MADDAASNNLAAGAGEMSLAYPGFRHLLHIVMGAILSSNHAEIRGKTMLMRLISCRRYCRARGSTG